jgi:hypothetical protein
VDIIKNEERQNNCPETFVSEVKLVCLQLLWHIIMWICDMVSHWHAIVTGKNSVSLN